MAPGIWRRVRPCLTRFPSLTLTLSVFRDSSMDLRNPLNRRTRTRIYGGVAGARGRPPPLCRLRTGLKREGKQTDPSPVWIDSQQSPQLKFMTSMSKGRNNLRADGFRRNVLCTDLDHAR